MNRQTTKPITIRWICGMRLSIALMGGGKRFSVSTYDSISNYPSVTLRAVQAMARGEFSKEAECGTDCCFWRPKRHLDPAFHTYYKEENRIKKRVSAIAQQVLEHFGMSRQ